MDSLDGVLCVDIETASAVDIKDYGAWAYSQHESTRVYCVVFGYATSPGRYDYWAWGPGRPIRSDVLDFIRTGGRVLAHNVGFEKSIFANILGPSFDFPVPDPDQWIDTQALGLALNLPASKLEELAKSLGCDVQKDAKGAKLMREMAKAVERDDTGVWRYPMATNANLKRLVSYCRDDVGATLDSYYRLTPLSVEESIVWRIDQRINDRGVFLDQKFAGSLLQMMAQREKSLARSTFGLTSFELSNSTSTPPLKRWLIGQGVELPMVTRKKKDGTFHKTPSCDRRSVLEILERDDTPELVEQVLRNRVEANKTTSLKKLKRVQTMVGTDGRLRGALQYCGASTGRWASYGLQVHNLPKDHMDPGQRALADWCARNSNLRALELFEDQPLSIMSQLLRSVIIAAPGKDLIAADYSAIEARVIAWLAGQDDTLEEFAKGTDVYVYTAEAIGSDSRQLGKVCVLALGYGMGVLKFVDTAAGYGIGLSLKEGFAIQRAWRDTNPMIRTFWYDLETAVREVLTSKPGRVIAVGRLKVFRQARCFFIELPSGRQIRYWQPRIVTVEKEFRTADEDGNVITTKRTADEIQYFTMGDGRKMQRTHTYGGKLAENATQAVARDLLGSALPRIEAVDPYEVVMHAHDSIASEVPEGAGDVDDFCALMETSPPWAAGLPLAVEGYRGKRFRG